MKKLILLSLCLSLYFIGQGAVPTITGFSPTTGTIGTTVIITGTNFSTTPSNNIVYFGAVKATVSGSTSTKITLTVPAGAGSIVPISVTTGGLSAYSTASTTPTFNLINTPNLVPNYTLRNQAAGNMPTSVAIGDFNGDGIPDMASCSWESWSAYGKVSVFLGKGDGTFTTKPDVPAGNRPQCIVIGDLNGDGKADMAVANMNSYDISILLGNGDGTFTAAASLSLGVGYEPYKLTIGDINGDGIADIIAGGLNGNTNVNIFPGLGNGTFGTKISLAIGVEPYSIAIGDLNGDGKMDIVATNSKSNSNTISVLLGNGNGTFGTKTNFAISSGSGANPSSVVIGDFNGDGKADLATANSSENSVSVLLGDGNGSFGTATPYAIGNDPGSIVVGDFNGDGKTDLAACNYLTPSSVSILLGNGNGTFKPATNFPVGDAPGTIAIADFNNDGKADIATSNWTNNISILLYTTPPTITSFTPTSGGNGTTVTITGTNLTGATAVSFGGTAASSFTVVNATTVTAVVGSGTSGTISITTPGGTATGASDQFTYAAAPTVTGISPATGPVGTLVTITGTNLSYPTAFILGGVTAIAVSNDGTTLVGMVMPGAITGSVVVTTASGTATSTGTFTVTATTYPGMQQGSKLVGTVSNTYAEQGCSVSVSADGNTAIVGGFLDSSNSGAAWIYIRSGGEWIQQGGKLVGTGAIDGSDQGWSVSLSADGNTAIVGGYMDTDETGAAWVFTRLGGVWTQQGSKLVATGANYSGQGWSVSLSADGNTAIVGGYSAAWIYARSGGIWTQQGSKLLDIGTASNGLSVFISADGNTAIVGGCSDNSYQGAAWVYIRSGSTWTLQGNKLVGNGASGAARQGSSVSLSADGNTAIVGGSADNSSQGAAWVYTRSGSTWIQQGSKLVGTGNTGTDLQGSSVSLSGDGNTAMVGGSKDNNYQGAAWIYTRSGGVWTQKGSKLVGFGNKGAAQQGVSVSLSADGNTAIMGGSQDNSGQGAAWVFIPLATPTTQASAITCSSVQATQMNIGWTNGNGANRAVFVKAANTGTTIPVDNTTYSANTSFSSGSQIGSTGWYCVYNGTGTSVTITGLTAGTDYIAQVFEYNGTAGDEKYYTVPATDNPKIQKTLMGAPTVTGISPASGPTTGGTAVTITGTNLTVASAVMFGSTNATGYTVNSATQITAISPAGVAGATDVTITSAGGTSEIIASDKFTYVIPNSVPSDISLSSCTIDENVAANSTVGTLSSTDPDAGNAFTYTLVAGTGSTDNASFNINGNSLQITNSPDYETKNSYSVRVRTTDQGGLFFEKAFTITINDVNETPTDIALSASSINENVAANSAVGTLSSTDPDASNTFTYTLVAGTGSSDNTSFNISSNSLQITASPDFETESSYTVRVRTTDQGGLYTEKIFAITINNVNETPTDIALSASAINEKVTANTIVGTLSSTDPDAGNTFTYTLVAGEGGTDNASFNISDGSLRITDSPVYEVKSSYSIRIRTTDQGGLTYEKVFVITINIPYAITTPTATNIKLATATLGATITPADAPVLDRGICWSTTSGVQITDNKTSEGGLTGGTFTVDISGLDKSSTIYYKGYVTTPTGATLLSEESSFSNVPVFTGPGNWEDATRWNVQEVPGSEGDSPVINGNCTIAERKNGGIFCNDLTINGICTIAESGKDGIQCFNLTINSGARLTLNAAQFFVVYGTITNTCGAEGFVIKADPALPNATFAYLNKNSNPPKVKASVGNSTQINNDPLATVEMYSKASWNLNNPAGSLYNWQFFGIPVKTLPYSSAFDNCIVRRYNETSKENANLWSLQSPDSILTSGTGYELTQAVPTTYVFKGELTNADFSKTLTYSMDAKYPGQHIFGNPYTAAMGITMIDFGDKTEQSVYQYNTGTFNDWFATSGVTPYNGASGSPGQYTVSTVNTAGDAGIPDQIPSMQGFLVKTLTDEAGSIKFSYGDGENIRINTEMQRAPKKIATQEKVITRIDVTSAHAADRMWIFTDPTCTRHFDNGWDGYKMMGSVLNPQLFALEADGDYQIDAVNDLNETYLGFQAGQDTEYTLKFMQQNIASTYGKAYLVDLVAGTTTDITDDGSEYTFSAVSTPTPAKRFKIVTAATGDIATTNTALLKVFNSPGVIYVENRSDQKGQLTLYDLKGVAVKTVTFSANNLTYISTQGLIPGAYVGKAETCNQVTNEKLIIR